MWNSAASLFCTNKEHLFWTVKRPSLLRTKRIRKLHLYGQDGPAAAETSLLVAACVTYHDGAAAKTTKANCSRARNVRRPPAGPTPKLKALLLYVQEAQQKLVTCTRDPTLRCAATGRGSWKKVPGSLGWRHKKTQPGLHSGCHMMAYILPTRLASIMIKFDESRGVLQKYFDVNFAALE